MATVRETIAVIIPIFETIAEYTPNTLDDKVVAVLRDIVEMPAVMNLIEYLLGQKQVMGARGGGKQAFSSALHGAVNGGDKQAAKLLSAAREEAKAKGLNIALLMQYLPMILQLINTFIKKPV